METNPSAWKVISTRPSEDLEEGLKVRKGWKLAARTTVFFVSEDDAREYADDELGSGATSVSVVPVFPEVVIILVEEPEEPQLAIWEKELLNEFGLKDWPQIQEGD
jgi:hypothetical protein